MKIENQHPDSTILFAWFHPGLDAKLKTVYDIFTDFQFNRAIVFIDLEDKDRLVCVEFGDQAFARFIIHFNNIFKLKHIHHPKANILVRLKVVNFKTMKKSISALHQTEILCKTVFQSWIQRAI
jgi:hypothetical protein